MQILKRSLTMLLFLSLGILQAQAQLALDKQQELQATKTTAQDGLISIQQDQVRFTAPKTGAEMQLQVFDPTGQLVFDSGAVAAAELNWALRQANGEPLKSGIYAYTLSVKEAGAETARVRHGQIVVDRAPQRDGRTDRLWITSLNDSAAGNEPTAIMNKGVTIAGASASSEQESVKVAEGPAPKGESELQKDNKAMMPALVSGTTGQIAKFTSATDLGNSVITELNGKIGVGTTGPVSKFQIVSSAFDQLPPRVQSSGTDTFNAGFDFYHGGTGVGYVGVPDAGVGLAPRELLVYSAGKTSLWAGRQRSVTINPNGNVGIGTDDPGLYARLNVIGDYQGTAVAGGSTSGTGVIGTTTNGEGVVGIAGPNGYAGYFDGKVRLRGHLVPADYGMFDLGFADTGRWRYLYVYTVNADDVYATTVHTNNVVQTSDARMKKGITNLRYGLRELMQLRPVSFEWKDKSDGRQNLGLIAQETEQIIPEAVTRAKDPETPLGMNYTMLVPVVIKAVQEQQNAMTTLKSENESLQRQNTTLQRQNADLDTRIKALEQVMNQSQQHEPEIKRQ